MLRIRLTRTDMFLLGALLLALAGQIVMGLGTPRQEGEESAVASWEEEQASVKERVRSEQLLSREGLERRLREDPGLSRRVQGAILGGAVLLLVAIAGGLRMLWRFIHRLPVVATLGRPAPPVWGLREIFRMVLVILVAVEVSVLLLRFFTRRWQPAWLDHHVIALGHTLLIDAVAVAGVGWLFLRLGFRVGGEQGIGPSVRFALVSYATFLPLVIGLALAVAATVQALGHDPAPQAIFTLYLSETRTPVLSGLILLVGLAGPVAEELFFRGLLYGWLRNRIGVFRGLAVTALLFAGLHADAVAFLPILGLGFLFGWVYEKSGSLLAPISAHILHNAGMLYLASLVKDLTAL